MSRRGELSAIRFKQFRAGICMSYLVWDHSSRKAALIDAHREMLQEYRAYMAQNGLLLAFLIETHTHSDHASAAQMLAAEHKVPLLMSEATQSPTVSRKLKDGEKIDLGGVTLEAFLAPGHTRDSLCILAEYLLFTGDTLLISSTGRVDQPDSDPRVLLKTLQELLTKLPQDALVLPAHDNSGKLFSIVSVEKQKNSQLKLPTESDFVDVKHAEALHAEAQVSGPGDRESVASINVEKYANKLSKPEAGVLYLDIRDPEEFQAGHMPGTRNIPLSKLFLHLEELKKARRVYFSCQSGRRSLVAANTLAYIGLADAVNVSGGFNAWQQAGKPIQK